MADVDGKRYSVWQLTDGTVVIQGAGLTEEKLRSGEFTWLSSQEKGRPVSRIRERVFTLLERV